MLINEKQILFTELIARLLHFGVEQGYNMVFGEAMRGRQQAEWNALHCVRCGKSIDDEHSGHRFKPYGIKNSLHCVCLALDIKLLRRNSSGKFSYLSDTRDYQVLGEYWEKLHELCAWGGRFGDGGHFSIMHGGRK